MNDSGRAVAAILRDAYRTVSDLIVLHDDLDLPLGSVRVKIGGGHGGHNGLRSIIEYLGSPDFIRVRIGIGQAGAGIWIRRIMFSARSLPKNGRLLQRPLQRPRKRSDLLSWKAPHGP